MAEAANLSVSITGDASGLISALENAEAQIARLNSSAGTLMNEFNGKEAKITLTAVDNTAAGVSSAKANINSLTDKTITVSVKYNAINSAFLASGTRNAHEGLAVVNDERGISDPRELIEHNGRLMMFGGRDVIVPLSSGDKVYTARETKAIMSGMGLPHYASGKNNELFETAKADLTHYKNTHDMSPEEELAWWNELMEEFAYDSEVVKEIQEEIFSSRQKIWKAEKQANEDALSSYKKSSDAWIKYQTEAEDMSVSEQIEAYQRQLENYNAMVSEMVQSTLYSADEIKEIWEDFYDYKAGVDLKIGKLENESNYAVYEKWKSDAENWKNIRDTYDDWYEAGDSPVEFYEWSIERIQEMYDGGYIEWQEYRDDTMYATLDLYEAKMDEVNTLLERQKSYISDLKQQFSDEESALQSSWDVEDRAVSKAEISHQLEIYENAVTQNGVDKYKSLQEEMKEIEREEELYNLQKEHQATLDSLEESYDIVEANKKYLLAAIEESGVNIEGIVQSVNYDIQSMENTIASLFAQTISAIKSVSASSNSYSDNRNISITADSSAIIEALKNRVGLSISYGSYN
ncbi:MAG: hypothetical protein LIO53_02600 [Oscillospiraceae bacterium]|nr:hypothetical protein [Oscillospiraceae bacterium]